MMRIFQAQILDNNNTGLVSIHSTGLLAQFTSQYYDYAGAKESC